MTVLQTPQTVPFDGQNIEHRQVFWKFLATGSWTHTKLRFELEQPYITVPDMIRRKLDQIQAAADGVAL